MPAGWQACQGAQLGELHPHSSSEKEPGPGTLLSLHLGSKRNEERKFSSLPANLLLSSLFERGLPFSQKSLHHSLQSWKVTVAASGQSPTPSLCHKSLGVW